MADDMTNEKRPRRSKVSRSITVCLKCRQRKIKCDKLFPTCGNCAKAGIECLMLDPYTGERVHLASIQNLRMQLEEKTAQLDALKLQLDNKSSAQEDHQGSAEFGSDFFFGFIRTTFADAANMELPDREFVDKCVCAYFRNISTQLPILHRDYFLFHYYKPIYGRIGAGLLQGIFGNNFNAEAYHEEPLAEYGGQGNEKCLFFLFIMVAISSSQNQQMCSLAVSMRYQKLALEYANHVWRSEDVEDHNEIPKLEVFQSLLLLAQYSLMRPCNPGSWYLVGTCVRLCQDLGLDNEPKFLRSDDYYIIDLRRRLFWCCYSLDRQVSNYVGRQFAIDNAQIDCPLLTIRDDSALVYQDSEMKNMSAWLHAAPDSKKLTIHYINLRVLQGGIFEYIHRVDNRVSAENFSNLELQPSIVEHDVWKKKKHQELSSWLHDSLEDVGPDHEFDRLIMSLNYYLALIQIYEISPVTPVIMKHEHYMILFESGRQVMLIYHEIAKKKLINYSWVAINNLFMGCRSYLSSIAKCEQLKKRLVPQDLLEDCHKALEVFKELRKTCHEPAEALMKRFKMNISYTIQMLGTWEENQSPGGGIEMGDALESEYTGVSYESLPSITSNWEGELWGNGLESFSYMH